LDWCLRQLAKRTHALIEESQRERWQRDVHTDIPTHRERERQRAREREKESESERERETGRERGQSEREREIPGAGVWGSWRGGRTHAQKRKKERDGKICIHTDIQKQTQRQIYILTYRHTRGERHTHRH